MKKLLYLLSATLLVLGSCTNDYDACLTKNDVNPIKNDTISPPKTDSIPLPGTDSIPVVVVEPILLRKLAHTYTSGYTPTIWYSYVDNKIVSDSDESNLTFYTYTGDLITKIEKADILETVYSTKEYVYANGKVDYILSNEYGDYYKTKYQYNSDGTVSYSRLNSDSSASDGTDTKQSGKYTFSQGNLIKHQQYYGDSQSTTVYEYDSKNNPKLNILGYNLLIDQPQPTNNVTKRTILKSDNTVSSTLIYTYEYNEDGYPTLETQKYQIGDKITTETSVYSY